MRLKTYLIEEWPDEDYTEAKKVDRYIPKIKKDCKLWLNKIKSNPKGIFRGMRDAQGILKKRVRIHRSPLDTSKTEHEVIDNAFKQKFGWKPRSSGLFVTPEVNRAKAYGVPMIIFPIGKIQYLWSDAIFDLYFKLGVFRDKWKDPKGKSDGVPAHNIKYAPFEQINKLILSKYRKGMITKALDTPTEIMIQCKEYYAIPIDYITQWLVRQNDLGDKRYMTGQYSLETYKQFIKDFLL